MYSDAGSGLLLGSGVYIWTSSVDNNISAIYKSWRTFPPKYIRNHTFHEHLLPNTSKAPPCCPALIAFSANRGRNRPHYYCTHVASAATHDSRIRSVRNCTKREGKKRLLGQYLLDINVGTSGQVRHTSEDDGSFRFDHNTETIASGEGQLQGRRFVRFSILPTHHTFTHFYLE